VGDIRDVLPTIEFENVFGSTNDTERAIIVPLTNITSVEPDKTILVLTEILLPVRDVSEKKNLK